MFSCVIEVKIFDDKQSLIVLGTWNCLVSEQSVSSSELLGVIIPVNPRYEGEPVTGYTFEIELSQPEAETLKRQKLN